MLVVLFKFEKMVKILRSIVGFPIITLFLKIVVDYFFKKLLYYFFQISQVPTFYTTCLVTSVYCNPVHGVSRG